MAGSEEELKSLMKVKEESEKATLKLSIQKTKIMAFGPINSWQIDGETVTDFIFLGSKITADGDCGHEIKRHLLPKGNQTWILIERTDAETEAPKIWPPDVKNCLIWKDFDAGKDWRQEEKGMTEDEIIGWHHQIDGHEFEQGPGVGDGQVSLACCSSWVAEWETTEWLNWTDAFLALLI